MKIFVGSVTDSLLDDKATVAALDEDAAGITELEKAVMLDELLTSLREFEELEAIHEELADSVSGPE